MSVLNNAAVLLLGAEAGGGGGYEIERSLRFNSSDSAYLSRTPSTAGNRKTWTWAGWVKRSLLTRQSIFHAGDSGSNLALGHVFEWAASNYIEFYSYGSVSPGFSCYSTEIFRDPSAWYHLVVVLDTTLATEADRVKVYVNSNRLTLSGTFPTQNSDLWINAATWHNLGCRGNAILPFDGYLADIHFIDGQALDPTSFTEVSTTTGQLIPKQYTGSFGTNGFWLKFSDNSAATATTLGKDYSGNGNNWTPNNLSVTAGAGNDSLVDTPTSYGTDTGAGGEVRGNYATLNPLDGSPTGLSNGNLDAASANAYPTIFPGSGQWYYEVNGTGYNWDGTRANWTPRAGSHNFGQRPFAYTAPSGFKALCTTNLPAPVIAQPSTVFDVKTYSGNGVRPTSLSGFAFDPDLAWIKSRSGENSHMLADSIRGAGGVLRSDLTAAELTGRTDIFEGFGTNSIILGNDALSNASGTTYVAWCWDAGSSTVTNTDGTITSQVRANASAGFSIVGYDGPGGFQSVGHGLNTVPEMMIFKKRTGSSNWAVYHKYANANPQSGYLILNSTAGFTSSTSVFGNTLPTSSVFYLNGNSLTAKDGTVISYCFAPVAGYSSFGSYTGNGSADGPFVYLGFRPAVVIVKMSSSTGNWTILDDKREGYNVDNDPLFPNLTNAEGTTDLIDITSNGFKVRTTDATFNTNAGTYVYAAWAEFPFQYARAR